MALLGTLTHRKTRKLSSLLGIDHCFSLGILEAMWHLTSEQAPAGDIGHLTNQEICDEIYYSGDPDKLIGSLVESGFLEAVENPKVRLSVHNWEQHCPQYVRRKLHRNKKSFISPKKQSKKLTSQRLVNDESMTSTSAGTGTGTGTGTGRRGCGGNGLFEKFWSAYPKKVAKGHAQRWFDNHNPSEALVQAMLKSVATQKESKQWLAGYIPNPLTWLNGERWTDEIVNTKEEEEASILRIVKKMKEAKHDGH